MTPTCPICTSSCWEPVECTVCHRTKAPIGRSVAPAMAGGLCDEDCPGYRQEPAAGHLWPNEGRSDEEDDE